MEINTTQNLFYVGPKKYEIKYNILRSILYVKLIEDTAGT